MSKTTSGKTKTENVTPHIKIALRLLGKEEAGLESRENQAKAIVEAMEDSYIHPLTKDLASVVMILGGVEGRLEELRDDLEGNVYLCVGNAAGDLKEARNILEDMSCEIADVRNGTDATVH